ncbi:hypothetical protein GUITHDRAFT_143399 [Guillardia theta CCMP2712]|uniref:Uncharacterized protein n=1 Tax=Guillardia theta (strain CCMP2712) TaxID=905079 RepID=L1IUP7_GUITC|nr:hypothetical protein GUITHDRAFT_143399 [Guillardia theta CCMP2712]EKX39624.1 hypothetical protein GUITHDRAFT_143399 [Guillardia theta CCMP2712]|eukprot:XP_005826604.1 hypothetical protein GUITHDRAFT_143399 [Guillardia theta CCMP2712]
MSGLVLEVQVHRLQGEDLQAGGSVILTFGAGEAKKRTNPITLTVTRRMQINELSCDVELHSIIGENKTRIIGKCTLRMTGLIFPRFELSMGGGRMLKTFRMSGGRSADETLELKGANKGGGVLRHHLDISLSLKNEVDVVKDETNLELNRVDGETKRYDGYRRNNDRMIALEAVRGYNLPEDFSTDEQKGTLVRVKSGNNGVLIHVTGSFSIAIEDREDLVGKSYLTDLQIGDEAHKTEEPEDVDLTILIESLSLVDLPIIARFRLIRDTDDVYLDWNDSDGHDAEIEPFVLKITNEGVDEDAFNELKVEMRVSEEISEILPAGLEFPHKFKWKLRLWDGQVLAKRMETAVNIEKDQRMGFDTWLAQLKLVTVEELIFKEAREAIINQSYELLQQQTDHVLPDIETKYFVTVDKEDKAAFSHSLPVSPTSIRPKDRKRPVTQDVARRLARPEVPTRPTTPVTYTQARKGVE